MYINQDTNSINLLTLQNLADGLSPNVKKDRKKFGLRKKKSSGGSWGGSKNSHCSIDLSNNALPPPGSSPNKNFEPSDASPISVS